jgi:hypothetical protein
LSRVGLSIEVDSAGRVTQIDLVNEAAAALVSKAGDPGTAKQ